MAQTRINEWLSQVPQNGPWLVSLVLGALIAVELALLTQTFWGAGPVKSVQLPPQRAPLRPNQAGGVDVQAIIAAHPFGIAPRPTQDESSAPQSSANLVLAGTIATQDPKHGIAIISDGGPSKVYSVGDNIGGAALHSVYLDHVILDRGGALETLTLPRLLLAGGAPAARRQIGADPNTAVNLENVRRMVQQDPGLLNEVMRTVASYDNKAGKLRGFRVYPGRNRSAFNGLGLRPGDLVTAINGTTLDDPQHGQEIFNTIQSSANATVTIERGGQTIDVSMNIAQVASEASKDLAAAPAAAGAGPNNGGAGLPLPPEPLIGGENGAPAPTFTLPNGTAAAPGAVPSPPQDTPPVPPGGGGMPLPPTPGP
jgi:general secretion pathway protein C